MSGQQMPDTSFSALLRALYESAGSPDLATLNRQAKKQNPPLKLSDATLSDWLRGKSIPTKMREFRFLVDWLEGRAVHKDAKYIRKGADGWWSLRKAAWQARRHRGGSQAVSGSDIAAPAADLTAVVVARPETDEAAGHLFVADWDPMLGDDVAFELSGIIKSVHVEVPLLTDWLTAELARRSAFDIPDDDVKKQVLRPVRMAKGRSEMLGPELVQLARAAHAAHYTDAETRTILNRALSFKVNGLLSSADRPGYPHPLDLDEMAAFTLGYAEKDLIELGFDAGRGRGARGYVPREILLNCPELMQIGALCSPADSSASTRLYRACQFARDFTFIGLAAGRHLWTHFVLPQAFARYPFDAVIVDVDSVHSFGLP